MGAQVPPSSPRMAEGGRDDSKPMADLIFHDPTGKRARLMRLTGGLVASVAALLIAAFFATLATL